MDRLDGQVAIVSGSSSGIGEAVARDLAEAGAHVVVNSSSSVEAGQEIARSLPTESIYVQADISREEDDRALVAATIEKFGRLDILVNNAGWTTRVAHADLDALTNEILKKTFEVNVYGIEQPHRRPGQELQTGSRQCGGAWTRANTLDRRLVRSACGNRRDHSPGTLGHSGRLRPRRTQLHRQPLHDRCRHRGRRRHNPRGLSPADVPPGTHHHTT
jgi:NAD(P)-dependent dehydrogenase (short-subunit alcohol dehydrogenase family)